MAIAAWGWPAAVRVDAPVTVVGVTMAMASAMSVVFGSIASLHNWGSRSSLTTNAASVFGVAAALALPTRWVLLAAASNAAAGWVCYRRDSYKAVFNLSVNLLALLGARSALWLVLDTRLAPDHQAGRFLLAGLICAAVSTVVTELSTLLIIRFVYTVHERSLLWPGPLIEFRRVALGAVIVGLYSVSPWWGLLAVAVGITAIREVAGRGHEIASITDPKTGLGNSAALRERLHRQIARSQRQGSPTSVAVVDLDRFRRVNESHGHLGGDAALASVAARLRNTARENDLVARWGGDELAWLMPDTGLADAVTAAERFRRAVSEEPMDLGHGELQLTVSVGVATWRPEMTGEDLLEEADNRLYDAKTAGRNAVRPAAPATVS